MNLRELTIERCLLNLDPSQEGIVRECYRIVAETIRKMPHGVFMDEQRPDSENN